MIGGNPPCHSSGAHHPLNPMSTTWTVAAATTIVRATFVATSLGWICCHAKTNTPKYPEEHRELDMQV